MLDNITIYYCDGVELSFCFDRSSLIQSRVSILALFRDVWHVRHVSARRIEHTMESVTARAAAVLIVG